jgi:pyruvate ferredoxin oxidoreductase gamma subunit
MWFFGKDKIKIPLREKLEIRLEAIGGQGANSAGKILAETAVLDHGFTGNHFSSFGSEKRGTPVKSFVRISTIQKPIRSASYIRKPNLLVIFHEFMIASHPEVFDGVNQDTDVLINSKSDPQAIQLPKGVHPRWLGTLDATKISNKTKSGLNTVMLGAMIPFLPELKGEKLEAVISRYFTKISAEEKSNNLAGFKAGWNEVKVKAALPHQDRLVLEAHQFIKMGYENAPFGGVILNPGNSMLKDHESSRKGFAPKLNTEICCHCGYCDLVCPDYCFVWEKNDSKKMGAELLGIDYQYCKGCQKCIQICPVEALTLAPESEIQPKEKLSLLGSQNES